MKVKRKRLNIYLLPSFLTTSNILFGYLSLIYTLNGKYKLAALWIIIAGILDAWDGILARLTKTTTEFGMQLDSLADTISFGVAPSLLLHFWGLKSLGQTGWVFSFIFLTSGVLRLARFNVLPSNYQEKKYSIGLSIPAASLCLAALVIFNPHPIENKISALFIALLALMLSILMISKLKYQSYKAINVHQKKNLKTILLLAVAIAGIAIYTRIVLLSLMAIYILSSPLNVLVDYLKRKFKTRQEKLEIQEKN
ncbi:MAG: CDP-diacylglycerol--serine O-phosphatidyltransferase [Candidatus Aminicenantia bacterium]